MCILHKWSRWELIAVVKTKVDPVTREHTEVTVDSQERRCIRCGRIDRMDNTQDNRELIECKAMHGCTHMLPMLPEGGGIAIATTPCHLCNDTGWAFRQDVIDELNKRHSNTDKDTQI